MLRRLGAVAFGVIAIAFALAIRTGGDVDDADGVSSGFGAGDDPYDVFDDDEVQLLCAEELRAACEDVLPVMGFDVRVEPAWQTVDRLDDGGSLDADVWLTFRPFDEAARAGGAALGPTSPVLARSPIALVGPVAAVEALDAVCSDPSLLLACAATELAGDVALHDPATSAVGALVVASVVDELGHPPDSPAVTGEQAATVTDLLARARVTQVPFEDVMRARSAGVALTVEAELLAELDRLPFEEQDVYDEASVRYPLDVRPVEVVALSSASFRRTSDLHDLLVTSEAGRTFETAGYVVDGRSNLHVDFAPVLAGRPTVRTDLSPPAPALLQSIRELG